MDSAFRTSIVLGVENLEHPRLFGCHIARVVPPLVRIVGHVGDFVDCCVLAIGRVLCSGIVLKVLGHIAVLSSAWWWKVGNNSAEIILIDGSEVAEGKRILLYCFVERLPYVHDSPAFLDFLFRFFLRKIEEQNLLSATIRLVDMDESLRSQLANQIKG